MSLTIPCYKLVSFERKYRKYSEQLPVLLQGMRCYGYTVSCQPMVEFPVEDTGIFTDVEDVCRNMISKTPWGAARTGDRAPG